MKTKYAVLLGVGVIVLIVVIAVAILVFKKKDAESSNGTTTFKRSKISTTFSKPNPSISKAQSFAPTGPLDRGRLGESTGPLDGATSPIVPAVSIPSLNPQPHHHAPSSGLYDIEPKTGGVPSPKALRHTSSESSISYEEPSSITPLVDSPVRMPMLRSPSLQEPSLEEGGSTPIDEDPPHEPRGDGPLAHRPSETTFVPRSSENKLPEEPYQKLGITYRVPSS